MFRRLLMPAALAVCAVVWAGVANAQPVEYTRVCTAFGSGYFYSPGTETCIRSNTGDTRKERDNDFPLYGRTGPADHLDEARAGAAAAASLPRTFIDTGDAYAVSGGAGGVSRSVSGSGGRTDHAGTGGLGAALRYDEHLTFSGALAGTTGSFTPGSSPASASSSGAAAGRGGFNYSW
jgi:hypothetical protein